VRADGKIIKHEVLMTRGKIVFTLISLLCYNANLWGQGAAQPAPQTARQALIEMFFSKTPGTLIKHLPVVTRTALDKSGALSTLQQYSLLAGQLQSQGKSLQTFETGSVLLATEDPNSGQKIEITVENDSLQGDQDDIEVSFQTYKNGQPARTPYMPHVTFSMKQETGIWKLNEISVTLHLPLADPDFLKSITEGMKAHAAASAQLQSTSQSSIPAQSSMPTFGSTASDANVIAAMRNILAAEATYTSTYRSVGYTCTISDLDGFGASERNEHQAMLINSGLASGKRYGYVFTLSECGGTPASSFHLTAVPNGYGYGHRAFCADQSGAVRSSADGNPANCWTNGTPVQ
jgi:hypothetical protein